MSTSATKRLAALALLTSLGATAYSGAATPSPAATNPAPGATSGASTAPASSTEAAPEPSTNSITLQGAGATFPAPLYQSWFEKYNGRYGNVQIDYQANGSGAGIKAITEGIVDFGASDAAMKDDEIAKLPAGSKIVHIPTALGAVVVIYNLPGISQLNLDSANVAGIFLGTIKKWNDPAIAANNSGATLPDKDILVVHRSDGSGTTNAFTTYLDTVSPDWHGKVGKGKEVKWPTGQGAQTAVEFAVNPARFHEAFAADLPAGQTAVMACDARFRKGEEMGWFEHGSTIIVLAPGDFRLAENVVTGAQIASYTYLLAYLDQKDAEKGKTFVAFAYWALTDGQADEPGLGYAPLPAAIQQKAIDELHSITAGASPIWP